MGLGMLGFGGMKGTEDWVANQRPENWRQQILYLYPNGMSPLTALLSMADSERTDDPKFHWWDQTIESTTLDFTADTIYTDSVGGTKYTSGGVKDDVLYVALSANQKAQLVPGMTVLLRDKSNYTVDCMGIVVAQVTGGVTVRLLEDDDNGVGNDLSNADQLMVIGSAHAEGAEIPVARSFKPTEHYNYTQIFRTSLSITRTAMQTKLRTSPQEYQKMKAEALEMHGIDMELGFWHGVAMQETDSVTGKPRRTTAGLLNWIKSSAYCVANNICDYTNDTNITSVFGTNPFNGLAWTNAAGGVVFINEMLERIFRYGSSERIAFCGNGAILGIQSIAQALGQVNLQVGQKSWGMDIMKWVTPFGTIYLKNHPLWNTNATTRNMMALIEPRNIKYRYIQDTEFYPDTTGNNRGNRVDGKNEEWLTECGLEIHHPETMGILYGVGLANA